MKEQNKKKGFSLVELIVVIAIMVVLVAVLAPVFTKYVEQSRRATDVSNAASISEAILIGVADGETTIKSDADTKFDASAVSTINSTPDVQGKVVDGASFWYRYDSASNTCAVYVGKDAADKTWDLATAKGAQDYKSYTAAKKSE